MKTCCAVFLISENDLKERTAPIKLKLRLQVAWSENFLGTQHVVNIEIETYEDL